MAKNIKVVRAKKEPFKMILDGLQNFIIRPGDECYRAGNTLFIREYEARYTGSVVLAEVVSICAGADGLKGGYQIVSFDVVWSYQAD